MKRWGGQGQHSKRKRFLRVLDMTKLHCLTKAFAELKLILGRSSAGTIKLVLEYWHAGLRLFSLHPVRENN